MLQSLMETEGRGSEREKDPEGSRDNAKGESQLSLVKTREGRGLKRRGGQ